MSPWIHTMSNSTGILKIYVITPKCLQNCAAISKTARKGEIARSLAERKKRYQTSNRPQSPNFILLDHYHRGGARVWCKSILLKRHGERKWKDEVRPYRKTRNCVPITCSVCTRLLALSFSQLSVQNLLSISLSFRLCRDRAC